jgi:hypothetical protein
MWILLIVALVVAAVVVSPAAAQEQEREHLPRRSKPPAPGMRPSALPAYEQQLGVPAASEADRQFDGIVDAFLLVYFRAQPVRATIVGLHDYDALFPATDSAGISAWGAELEGFRARLSALDADRLGRERRIDDAILARRIRGELLDLRTDPTWKRDPGTYVAIVSDGIHALVDHDFAPLEDRTWNVIARLTGVPDVFQNARENLEAPPPGSTERAIEQAAELVRFLANELPGRVAPLRDDALREEFEHHLASASGSAAEYRYWLKTDLLARPVGARFSSLERDSLARLDQSPLVSPLDSLLRR